MEYNDISVVIPMFNSEKSIEKVLESIFNQTKIDYIKEIIIIDDFSSDSSIELVEKVAKTSPIKINLIKKQNNKGVSHSRNMGVSISSSSWIAFLDSDDLWLPYKIEKQIEIIEKNPEIDVIGGAINKEILYIGMKPKKYLFKVELSDICIKTIPQPSTVLIKKEIFNLIGGFDETQRFAEDSNFFMRIADDYNMYYLPIQLVEYGFGKSGFGESGLSANLKEMHKGTIKNIKEMRKEKRITILFYLFLKSFYNLKYLRRVIITKLKKRKRNGKENEIKN